MKTLVFGAGPLGTLYAHRFIQAGKDVTILARGQRYDWIQANGLALVDEITGAKEESSAHVVDELRPEDEYNLVVVLIRKNKLPPVFKTLAANARIRNILFMGNNARGFRSYLDVLPEILNVKAIQDLLGSKFAEVAFVHHGMPERHKTKWEIRPTSFRAW